MPEQFKEMDRVAAACDQWTGNTLLTRTGGLGTILVVYPENDAHGWPYWVKWGDAHKPVMCRASDVCAPSTFDVFEV